MADKLPPEDLLLDAGVPTDEVADEPAPQRGLSDDQLKEICAAEIDDAIDFTANEVAERRRMNLGYYLGEPFGDEVEGRSQVVSTDVQDVVEAILPELMEMFGASDRPVEYQPVGEEDKQDAEDATEYAAYVFYKENPGFTLLYDWFKDALIEINGYVRPYWDPTPKKKRETFTGLDDMALAVLVQDPYVEIVEHTAKTQRIEIPAQAPEPMPVPGAMAGPEGMAPPPPPIPDAPQYIEIPIHDVAIIRTDPCGRIVVEGFAPDQFIVSRGANSIDDARFCGVRVRKMRSELRQMGFDPETVESLPAEDYDSAASQLSARDNLERVGGTASGDDNSTDHIWITDGFIRADYDGDGIAELRRVVMAGSGGAYELLGHEEADEHNFCDLTPVRMPHQPFGRAVADLARDIQRTKSAVWRMVMDNFYSMNSNRMAVWDEKVEMGDLLDNRVGGYVRTDGPPAGIMMPLTSQPIGAAAFPLIEYLDGVRETRTGVTRYNQGLDADSLNKTASGIKAIMSSAQRRIQMIARLFAETGVKRLFRHILKLSIENQEKPRKLLIRGKPLTFDPSKWNPEMDATIHVGLGTANRDTEAMMMRLLLDVQKEIVTFQGGANGPLVDMKNVHKALMALAKASGVKHPEQYFSDPANAPPPEPKPDPKAEQQKAENELKAQDQANDHQVAMLNVQLEYWKAGLPFPGQVLPMLAPPPPQTVPIPNVGGQPAPFPPPGNPEPQPNGGFPS